MGPAFEENDLGSEDAIRGPALSGLDALNDEEEYTPDLEDPPAEEIIPELDEPIRDKGISLEQAAQLYGQSNSLSEADLDRPEGVTLEEASQVMESGVALKDGATLEEADKHYAMQALSGRESAQLRKDLGDGEVTVASAMNTMRARGEYFKRDHGWLDTAGYYLGIPQMAATRATVNLLENFDLLTTEDAKDLLSRDEILPSDLVNFYIKNPEDTSQKVGRFMVGLAADVLLDPLNALSFGLAGAARKAVFGGGKVISNLQKMAKTERRWVKSIEAVDKIITSSNDLEDVVKHADDIEALLDKRLSFNDFIINGKHSKETKLELRKTFREMNTGKTMGQEFVDGERVVKIGFRIPFTNMAKEFEAPRLANQAFGKAIGVVPYLYDKVRGAVMSTKSGQRLWKNFSPETLLTRTGKHLVDFQQQQFLGKLALRRHTMGQFEDKHRTALKIIQNSIGDEKKFDGLLKDLSDEIELRLLDPAEFIERGFKPYQVDKGRITTTSQKNNTSFRDAFLSVDFTRLKKFLGDPSDVQDIRGGKITISRFDKGTDFEFVLTEKGTTRVIGRLNGSLPSKLSPRGSIYGGAVHQDYAGQGLGKLLYNNASSSGVNLAYGNFVSKNAKKTRLSSIRTHNQPITGTKDWDALVLGKGTESEDILRYARLEKHPDMLRIVDEHIEINGALIDEIRKRGIPFDQLKYSGPGSAKNYLKHMLSNEFFEKMKVNKEVGDDVELALDFLYKNVGGVSGTERGRQYRGTIQAANEASMDKLGVKIFVDDPIELIARRSMEMERLVQSYDLMDAAATYAVKGKAPGPQWTQFDPAEFNKFIMRMDGQLASGTASGLSEISVGKLDQWKHYVPPFFKTDEKIFLPYDVYDRLLYQINGHQLNTGVMSILSGMEGYMNVFRNSALTSIPYLMNNAMGNMLMHLTNNGLSGVRGMGKAMKLMIHQAGEYQLKHHSGKKFMISGEQLMKEAIEDGAFNAGLSGEFKFAPLAQDIASNREAAKPRMEKLKNIGDYAFFWRQNRYIAEKSDQLPKLATYITRRSQGFSRQAAAELADRYFYTFNMGSRNQDIMARAIPFSKFPMKTFEYVMDEVRDGNLAKLAVPAKVRNMFEGTYVEDPEIRAGLDKALPEYSAIRQPILGEMFPGGREILMEIPWAATTMSLLFNPLESEHPMSALVHGAMSLLDQTFSETEDQYADITDADAIKMVKEQAFMFLPWYVKDWATIQDLKDNTFGGFFADQHKPELPQGKDRSKETIFETDKNVRALRFDNSVEFAEAMSHSWLYKMYFGDDKDNLGPSGDQEKAGKGEFIRKKFRSLTGGLGTMTKMDQNILFNQLAMQWRINRLSKSLAKDINANEHYIADGALSDKKYLKNLSEMYPQAKELLVVMKKRQALTEMYDFILQAQEISPDEDLIKTIFGVDHVKMDTADAPMVYDEMTIRANQISDDQAVDVIDKIRQSTMATDNMDPDQIQNEYEPVDEIPYEEPMQPSGEEEEIDLINEVYSE